MVFTEQLDMRTPNFYIVGAPKCGTTAMHRWLGAHPEVYLSTKELHFFGRDLNHQRPALDARNYRSFFAEATDVHKRIGEVAVWYLMSESAPAEIHSFSPSARIIAMLRRPDEMLYSLHSQLLYSGEEDLKDFEAALDAQPDRAQGHRIPPSTHRGIEAPPTECLQYFRVAAFADGVARYQSVFGVENVHIVLHDEIRDDAAKAFEGVLQFLDVDPSFRPDFDVVNPNTVVRSQAARRAIQGLRWGSLRGVVPAPMRTLGRRVLEQLQQFNTETAARPPLDPKIGERIREAMADDIRRLEQHIGRDLSAWLKPATT